MEEIKDLLQKFCMTNGISGHEASISKVTKEVFAPYCDETYIDALGNVIGHKKGNGKHSIMLAAHLDEIGLMVTKIEEGGFVRFTTIGGYDLRTLVAQEVMIHGKEDVFGVIGIKPPHVTSPEEAKKTVPLDNMVIDTGFSKEALEEKIRPGNVISINAEQKMLLNDIVASKAIDNRMALVVLVETMKRLQSVQHDLDIYFVGTSQEEIGMAGAQTSTYAIEPTMGIAVDVTFAKQPGLDPFVSYPMGEGITISRGSNVHPKMYEFVSNVAKENNVAFETSVHVGSSWTDLHFMQTSKKGLAGVLVSVPCKYMHTATETISAKDIKEAGRLLSLVIAGFNGKEVEEILCY